MTQAQATVHPLATTSGVAARSSGSGTEAPDILFIVRHYIWLIVIGTVAGLLIGWAAFWACRRWKPEYSVFTLYQVLPPQAANPITPTGPEAPVGSEDIVRFINRQKVFVQRDEVLQKALESDAFQQDWQNPQIKSHWYRTYAVAPKVYLKQQVKVEPVPNTDVFRLGLSGPDRVELARLVKALSDAYYTELRDKDKTEGAKRLEDLTKMQGQFEEQIKGLDGALADFRDAHNISALMRGAEIKSSALGTLTAALIQMENNVAAAKARLDQVRQQVESGTLELSAETLQYVENDGQIRGLESQVLGLKQDRAVMLQNFGPGHRMIQAIDTRMGEIAKQEDDIREKLKSQVRLQILEGTKNMMKSMEDQAADLRTRRDEQDRELKDMDKWLVEYRAKEAALADLRDLHRRLTEQVTVLRYRPREDVERVSVLSPAQTPDPQEMTFPNWKVFLPMGFGAGLLLSFGLAYLLELTNTRVRTPRDITRTMQMPLLGFVPDQEDDSFIDGNLATSVLSAPSSMIAESFRQIRGRLAAAAHAKPMYSLLVASVEPGGGATTVACNLATSMALNDLRVLLVDGNFYRPGLKNCYPNVPTQGFSDVLSGDATLEQVAVANPELPRLHLIGAGSKPASTASELLAAKVFRDLLAEVRNRYDLVIIDGAPMNLVSDSITVAGRVDGVVAVVRAGTTKRGTVARVREQLRQVHATLLGLVLNAAQVQSAGYFRENYRTFYQYAAPPSALPTSETN